jgi:hypothetical protein
MKKLALLLLPLTGCVVYAGGPAPVNSEPWFSYADAGCMWDAGYRDYVFFFDVDVEDDLGPEDVQAVWVDIYNSRNGEWVDGFELAPEPGKSWYSAWIGSTTFLDPGFPDYEAFFQAQDGDGAIGTTSVYMIPCR